MRLRKRVLSVLLTLCMVIGLMPVMSTTAEAAWISKDKFSKDYSLSGDQVKDIILVAKAQVGKKGKELDATNNWCTDFVFLCARLADIPESVIPSQSWVPSMKQTILNNGGKVVKTPQAGDLVFYLGGDGIPGHVGLMIDSENSIQGNIGSTGFKESVVWSGPASWYNGTVDSYVRPNYNQHTHTYNANDICTNCGSARDYSTDTSRDWQYTTMSKTLKVTDSSISLRKTPYTDSQVLTTASRNGRVTAIASVRNSKGNVWYKVTYGGVIGYIWPPTVTEVIPKPEDSTLRIDLSSKEVFSIVKGSVCPVTGTVSSNFPLKLVSATLDGKEYAQVPLSSTSLNLRNSSINNDLIGASLSVGTHTVVIKATDTSGKEVTKTITVTVTAATTGGGGGGTSSSTKPATPTITYSDIDGGKRVTITQTTTGATLYYYYYLCNGKNLSTTNPSVSFDVYQSGQITAYSDRGGRMSEQASRYVTVTQLPTPTISANVTGSGADITITSGDNAAEIWYSVNGGAAQKGTYLHLDQSATVTAYAKRPGWITSGTVSKEITVSVPAAPKVTANNTKLAVKDSVLVSWNAVSNAAGYRVSVTGPDNEPLAPYTNYDTKGATKLALPLNRPGAYTVSVTAVNTVGSSEAASITLYAMEDVTVTFKDGDGSVFNQQTVRYGCDATKPSQIPAQRGYTFTGWEGGSLKKITEDTEFTAGYQINTYSVKFYDYDGTLISSQTVEYGESAAEPEIPDCGEGYLFAGWAVTYAQEQDSGCDWTCVDSNMVLKATKCWADPEIPVLVEVTGAIRNSATGNYQVTVSVKNSNLGGTTAMLRVVLKNSNGQMVKTGYREIELENAGTIEETVTLRCSEIVSKAEAYVLGMEGNDKTGSALSKVAAAKIVEQNGSNPYGDWSANYGDWSRWSSSVPETVDGRQVEQVTLYRYRDKQYTTSTSSYLDGWTNYNQSTSYGTWVDQGWTSWQPTTSDTTTITDTRTVTDSNGYTRYTYYHYWGKNSSGQTAMSYGNAYWKNYEETTSTSEFPKGKLYDYKYQGYVKSVSGKHGSIWWFLESEWIPAVTHTEWRYSTRTATTTYWFYKWGSWSAWSDSVVTSNGDRQVETKTVYRYRDKAYTDITDSGVTATIPQTISGTLSTDADISGKLATVMVYNVKNTDPNESQIQYIGQTTIGAGNEYSFQVWPKADPTTDSGDYIVSLGVQGATGLVNVDVIPAPKETYRVTFMDGAGNAVEVNGETVQLLEEGADAEVPDVPEREGYTFVMWDRPATNVHSDLTITAVYTQNQYAVAYVDWTHDNILLDTCAYGDPLFPPELEDTEGYTFNGWTVNGEAVTDGDTVTGNTVVTADWTTKRYQVTFYDEDGAVYSQQNVAYGTVAELPADLSAEGKDFLGWSTENPWWNVTDDVEVYPILIFSDTAMTPAVEENGVFTDSVQVEITATEDGEIYYTTDGTDPIPGDENSKYEGPFEITEDTTVKAVTSAAGKNESEIVEVYFTLAKESEPENPADLVEVGTYSVNAEPGKEIELKLMLEDNPGLAGYLFVIECDPGVFYLDCDEDGSLICQQGEASREGMMLCSPYSSGGWQVLWFSPSASDTEGNLFSVTLKVSEEAQTGLQQIKVSYSPMNTVTAEDAEVRLDSVEALFVTDNYGLLGDVSGDGYVTAVDVIQLARYLINDISFTEQQRSAADVTGDGKITAADVVRAARYLVGLAELG